MSSRNDPGEGGPLQKGTLHRDPQPETPEPSTSGVAPLPRDLETCPRCGEAIARLLWGQTNCPRCGLHFECC